MSTVYTRAYAAPPVNEREIMRYAGIKTPTEELMTLIREAEAEARDVLTYKVCTVELPVDISGRIIDFGAFQTESEALAKNLLGCDRAIIFAATVGIGLDRLIARYGVKSPSRALILQSLGAERIESLCDRFTEDIANSDYSGCTLMPRFSPGYGDLPLQLQREIFRVLDCPKRIGLTLNESLIMSPTKSVSAIIGIK